MATNGLDLSHYQGTIDWNRVKTDPKGYVYAFMKCTESTTYYDTTCVSNNNGAVSVGIENSFYHFWRSITDGKAQATFFLSKLPKMPKMPLVIDVEDSTNIPPTPTQDVANKCLANIRSLAEELTRAQGRKPIIYTGAWFWNRIANLYSPKEPDGTYWWSKYDLWVATYGSAPVIPFGWNRWVFWQYTNKGVVSGINASCDLDYFNGDFISFQNYVSASVTPPPNNSSITVNKTELEHTLTLNKSSGGMINQAIDKLNKMLGGTNG
jgi:lysozyme